MTKLISKSFSVRRYCGQHSSHSGAGQGKTTCRKMMLSTNTNLESEYILAHSWQPQIHQWCCMKGTYTAYHANIYYKTACPQSLIYSCKIVILNPSHSSCTWIIWSWYVEHISWSMRVSSTCLTTSWWQCGQLPTTVIAVATLPQSWSSLVQTSERQSCSKLCLTLKELSHRGSQHPTSCEQPHYMI